MSFRKDRFQTYNTSDIINRLSYIDDVNPDELHELFLEVLQNGIHGLCFSLYEEGQEPGDIIPDSQIRKRMQILSTHTKWVRSFSTTEGNENIPRIAHKLGMKTLVGAWLGSDLEKNEEEIQNLVSLAKEGVVDIAAVGNEVLYRNDLDEGQLLGYIRRVKEMLPDTPVSYVDAYYEFVHRRNITDACDVILCNCYPYWEGTSFQDSLNHMKHMYYSVVEVAKNKKVIISETGWPSAGESLGGAIPSRSNALKYFVNTQLWAQDETIEVFYFSSFDEDWKKGDEGEVGAYWGIYDSKGKLKF